MQTINERINIFLKETGTKKVELARRLNISTASVSNFCSGKTNPSNQTIALICKEFNVNETWLRTGEGEMFQPASSDILDEMAAAHGLSPEFAVIVRRLLKLPPEVQDQIVEAVFAAVEQIQQSQGETQAQRDARLLREEADAVEQEGERSSASHSVKDA